MMVSGRKAALLIAAAAAGLATGGCTKTQDLQGYLVDETLVSAVQPGIDNKDSVQYTLGRPTFTGTFDQNDWYYVSRRTKNYAFNHPRVNVQTILHVRFDQAGDIYDVPVTIAITYTDGKTSESVVIVSEATTEARLPLTGTMRAVEANPDGAAIAILEKK